MENNSFQSAANEAAQSALQQQQQQQVQTFWNYQRQEIEKIVNFKNHSLPIARVKKIMKADKNVRMISAEAPILFSKACELFILELTTRSWLHAEENNRRTLQKKDIVATITGTEIFDFLSDVVPKEEAIGLGTNMMGSTASGVPYYFPPMGQPDLYGVMMQSAAMPRLDPSGVMMPRAAMPRPSVFVHPPPPPPPSQAWPSSYANGGRSGLGNIYDGQS